MGYGGDDTDTEWLEGRVRLSREDLARSDTQLGQQARTDGGQRLGDAVQGVRDTAVRAGSRALNRFATAGGRVRSLAPTSHDTEADGDDATGRSESVQIEDSTEFNWSDDGN